MPMTELDRKNYNKEYYNKNRTKALQKACTPITCPCCLRVVTRNRLNVHLKTKLCQKTQKNTDFINNRLGNGTTEFENYINDRLINIDDTLQTIGEFVKQNPIV
jgi:hypothetical protein